MIFHARSARYATKWRHVYGFPYTFGQLRPVGRFVYGFPYTFGPLHLGSGNDVSRDGRVDIVFINEFHIRALHDDERSVFSKPQWLFDENNTPSRLPLFEASRM
ncbi:hypothetical protein RB620_29120 [Paenibacillus sp. LHD-117]|uniref:hypothetical protein n=1 Tax=Paenibacillus sp. LHD-117 TaxID=3071412 RepID=UPI0027E06F5B|nr:hypothetical protein [Paenibacillus sp. LHD-117]MDQ6423484.1 hypothetical protein [Paenibacillus sp. LHD-117]